MTTTIQASHDMDAKQDLEAFGGIQIGVRPCRAHDYVFVAERDTRRCALLVGRELRDDWEDRTAQDTPAAVRVLAGADDLFLPLADGAPGELLGRFRRGFQQLVTQSQRDLQQGAKQQDGEAPSLTLTLAYIDGRRLYVGHVGDDRCYVLRNQHLRRMTTDHTAAPPTSDRPLMSDPRLSRKVLNVVGGFSDDLETETLAINLEPGDIVLLCTPGVSAVVPEPVIEETLQAASRDRSMSLDAMAEALFRAVPEPQRRTDRALALARLRSSEEE